MVSKNRIPAQAPYDVNGHLLRQPVDGCEWWPNEPVRRALKLAGSQHGKSGAYTVWRDSWGHTYPMSLPALIELLSTSTVSQGVSVGWWHVEKRWSSYGICQLNVDR